MQVKMMMMMMATTTLQVKMIIMMMMTLQPVMNENRKLKVKAVFVFPVGRWRSLLTVRVKLSDKQGDVTAPLCHLLLSLTHLKHT